MPSSRSYMEFVLDQLSPFCNVKTRKMMGEYIIYVDGVIVGGIYDDRFLIKPTEGALRLLGDVKYAFPYEGGKKMIEVENLEDMELLSRLMETLSSELRP